MAALLIFPKNVKVICNIAEKCLYLQARNFTFHCLHIWEDKHIAEKIRIFTGIFLRQLLEKVAAF